MHPQQLRELAGSSSRWYDWNRVAGPQVEPGGLSVDPVPAYVPHPASPPARYDMLFGGVEAAAELVRRRRMLEAKRLLTYTRLPVLDIAHRAGFGDAAFFSRTFKATFDVTPSEFRKRAD